ncbi:hypothetical protein, partial [Xanthomonas euvesicatoria]|uniref:hypothetical protein n=1 Tax=Xanthomonas euvesicatoria TaxID=456327 RepID=UPI000AF88E7F
VRTAALPQTGLNDARQRTCIASTAVIVRPTATPVSILYTVQQHAAAHHMGDVFLTNGCTSAQVHAQAASGPVNGTGRVAMTR